MSQWCSFNEGAALGQRGSEGGIIVCDDEYAGSSRITLERDGLYPWSVTCGIYGWMVHTCFFATADEARHAYKQMKPALAEIVEHVPSANDPEWATTAPAISRELQEFVRRFP
jgi:hypothetical protein